MVAISIWGPTTWNFLHTLCKSINNDNPKFILNVLDVITEICKNLPCPDCSDHATEYFKKVKRSMIVTKHDLSYIIFVLHNIVNQRKKKEIFKFDNMDIYDNNNLIDSYNKFIFNFHTNNNMKLLMNSFKRKLFIEQLKKWIYENVKNKNLKIE
jgi:hypothetical protein